jgi:hypothetical protein
VIEHHNQSSIPEDQQFLIPSEWQMKKKHKDYCLGDKNFKFQSSDLNSIREEEFTIEKLNQS